MPELTDSPGKAFIGRELRPDVTPSLESSPPLAPDVSAETLRKQAAELLGPEQSARLGVGDPDGLALQSKRICTKKPDVTWSAVDGEAVLLDLSNGYYFSLNRVGTVIWELMDGSTDLGSIHSAVCNRFDVDPGTAWEDILSLVRRLHGEKLLSIS